MHVLDVVFKCMNTSNSPTHIYNTPFDVINMLILHYRNGELLYVNLVPIFYSLIFVLHIIYVLILIICIHDFIDFNQVKIKLMALDLNNIGI